MCLVRGVSNDQLTEEEKTRAWFTDGSACYADTTQEQTVATFQLISGTILKDSDGEKFSQWAELCGTKFKTGTSAGAGLRQQTPQKQVQGATEPKTSVGLGMSLGPLRE